MKKAFTLAEILIVLSVIAIITAILLPAARNAMPDKNVIKFKKAHYAFFAAVHELVNSEKYYSNGDLGLKPDGTPIDGTHTGDTKYFCQTLADVLNVKEVNCLEADTAQYDWKAQLLRNPESVAPQDPFDLLETGLQYPCLKQIQEMKNEIVLSDGTVLYQTSPSATFGISNANIGNGTSASRFFLNMNNEGFYRAYKTFCIDIDGIPDDATPTNCVNECPFGYGIRFDGKIMNGSRTNEWVNKIFLNK